jgi:SAM-dependent methyltransferase
MKEWNNHYKRDRSHLSFPDENLVRLLSRAIREESIRLPARALDLGCGSGRHIRLLKDQGLDVTASDVSLEGLRSAARFSSRLVLCENRLLPFRDKAFDLVVAWGSLHYGLKDDTRTMILETGRILKPGGILMATLRSERDTALKGGKDLGNNQWVTDLEDIQGSTVSLFSREEGEGLLEEFFHPEIGLAERIPPGQEKRISHWIINARRR